MAEHATGAPAQGARASAQCHKTLASLYSAKRQMYAEDLRRDAVAAWARFRSCLEGLPAAEAQPLWQSVAAEATTHAS
jgi:hypothetical protein